MTDPDEKPVVLLGDVDAAEALGINCKLLRFAFQKGMEAGRSITALPTEFPDQSGDDCYMAASAFGMALGIGLIHTTNPELAAFVLERAGNAVKEAQEHAAKQTAQARH